MQRKIFSEEHELFRKAFRTFVEREVKPKQATWNEQGRVDRETWTAAGEGGFLCPWLEPEYGGAGGDFLHSAIVIEELAFAYESGFSMSLHSDIITPYIHEFGTDAQRKHWLPKCAAGDVVTAIAMTEPGTGSDLASIATTAERDGDEYVINGAKTFISNGLSCELCIVAAKTNRDPSARHKGLSLFLVEAERSGFIRGKKLEKMGMPSQDTSELAFEGLPCARAKSPRRGRRGVFDVDPETGSGALGCWHRRTGSGGADSSGHVDLYAGAQSVRQADRELPEHQGSNWRSARPKSKWGERSWTDCSRSTSAERIWSKSVRCPSSGTRRCWARWSTPVCSSSAGYGYMLEYPVTRAYMDARVQRIYAGTNEIMKIIIAKQLGL